MPSDLARSFNNRSVPTQEPDKMGHGPESSGGIGKRIFMADRSWPIAIYRDLPLRSIRGTNTKRAAIRADTVKYARPSK